MDELLVSRNPESDGMNPVQQRPEQAGPVLLYTVRYMGLISDWTGSGER